MMANVKTAADLLLVSGFTILLFGLFLRALARSNLGPRSNTDEARRQESERFTREVRTGAPWLIRLSVAGLVLGSALALIAALR